MLDSYGVFEVVVNLAVGGVDLAWIGGGRRRFSVIACAASLWGCRLV